MKRGRSGSVVYAGTSKAKYARGTKGNPIILEQRVSRAVNRAVQRVVEKKGVDGDMGLAIGALLSTTNTNDDCIVTNLIPPGNASYNRVGRQVTLKSLRLWGTFVHENNTASAAAYQDSKVRMVVVWDKVPSGAVPPYDIIFGITNQAGTENCEIFDPIRYDSMDRFRIISDTVIVCNTNGGGGETTTSKVAKVNYFSFDKYIKLPNLKCNYSGQSSPCTIADIGQGALYVYFRAQDDTASNNVTLSDNSRFRLRYTD